MQRVALRARRLARIQAQCAKAAGTSSSKYYTEAAVLHRLERTLTLAVTLALTLAVTLTLTLAPDPNPNPNQVEEQASLAAIKALPPLP